jgi:hypothetical protein
MTITAPLDKIERAEAALLQMPQVPCPVTHIFAPGIYWREVFLPAGVFAIGHQHKTEHLNVLLAGRVRVLADGRVVELKAPQVFKSGPGTRKMVYAVEPTRWANVHTNPADERDEERLEMLFIEKSTAFLEHQQDMQRLLAEPKERT